QGLLDHYWSTEISEGFAHQFVGLAMLVPAFFLILLVAWALDKIFVEEVADAAPEQSARSGLKASRKAPVRKPPPAAASPAADAPRRPSISGGGALKS